MTRAGLLKRIPPFDCLNPQELDQLSTLLREVSFLKGKTICREGEEGDTLFIIVSGELEVWAGREGEKRVVNRLSPGDFFGEITLLTGERRTATVKAGRDARLLALDRSGFESFFVENPKILEHFSRVLAQRLTQATRGEVKPRSHTVVAVSSPPGFKGKTLTASVLAGLLEDFSRQKAIHVEFRGLRKGRASSAGASRMPRLDRAKGEPIQGHIQQKAEGPARLGIGVDKRATKHGARECLRVLLEALKDDFPYIVLDLSTDSRNLVSSALMASDFVLHIEGPEALIQEDPSGGAARRFRIINRFNPNPRTIPINHMEPFVLPVEPALHGSSPAAQCRYVRDHPRTPIGRSLHRLARKILGTTVGLALGGGAAFGIAHVGVLKVLEENSVPIDLIAGTSTGSVVAIGYAAGRNTSELVEFAKRLGTRWKSMSMLDFTLTKPGFLRGDRLIRFLSPLLKGVEAFEDLELPCRTVATDIDSGERVTIQTGRLDMALRASCSVPMVWSPVAYQGRPLVDGAVVDPVPAEVVQQMGADVCIAVNVVPPLQRGVETFLSRFYRQANRLNPLSYISRESQLPNLFDIIMNSIQTLQYELGNFKAISADVRINPNLSGHTWIEFYKPMAFIDKGARAAEQALPEIRRVLAERSSS
jgi:NTE family protein